MEWMRKRKHWGVAVLILLVLLALGLGASSLWAGRQRRKVEALARALTSEEARALAPEQRRERWRELRQEMQKLSPTDRRKASEPLAAQRRQAMRDKMNQYFRLPKQERTAFLDREIDRMESRRQQWQQARGNSQSNAGAGPNARPTRSAAERDRMRQQRIDSASPEDHALMSEYFKQLNQRRQQRNLPVRGPGMRG